MFLPQDVDRRIRKPWKVSHKRARNEAVKDLKDGSGPNSDFLQLYAESIVPLRLSGTVICFGNDRYVIPTSTLVDEV